MATAVAALALNRDPYAAGERFPEQLRELQGYFRGRLPGQRVQAVPGSGLDEIGRAHV